MKPTERRSRRSCQRVARLYVIDIIGGPSRVRVFDNQGHVARRSDARLQVSAVDQVLPIGGDDCAVFHLHLPRTASVVPLRCRRRSIDAHRALRDLAGSVRRCRGREGVRDLEGRHPSAAQYLSAARARASTAATRRMLEGYGGFGISTRRPTSSASQARVWLDQGGVYAIANLRGGGEYGEEWHKAGNLTHKQNVFDDFIACAQYLIDKQVHVTLAPRDHRRQQWRTADGRGVHAAAGALPRRGVVRRHLRHAARRAATRTARSTRPSSAR